MKKRREHRRRKTSGLRGIAYFSFASAAVILVFMVWATFNHSSPTADTAPVPPYFSSAAAARPFPQLLSAADFIGHPAVEHAYAVAARIPGVLAQQPCYCDCDRMGHRSLLDCYSSEHAAGCGVCLMEAEFAAEMTQQGQSSAVIRQEIVRGEWRNVRLNGALP